MKSLLAALPMLMLVGSLMTGSAHAQEEEVEAPLWTIAIHGGAGVILREDMTPEREAEYRAALQSALDAGAEVLRNGGTAMEAVQAAIVPMEDDPKFNAGRGAVYTWEGRNELDAAIMDGRTRAAGAITGVTQVKNPILLADAVLKDGRHVFLSGAGAEEFARDKGLEIVDPSWFETEWRKQSLERLKAEQLSAQDVDHKWGTVGAVALDSQGNLAAGTSTGGLTGKRWGRIGDAPVIGAGTYADNRSCAVSATGAGEYFIRVGVAHEICTQLRMSALEIEIIYPEPIGSMISSNPPKGILHPDAGMVQAVADEVLSEVATLGGDGGVIIVTPGGHAIFSFNTPGMYRGRANSEGLNEVAIFGAEEPSAE
ncbi:isoaspartyl peptidase/L-asparaginase family protein [Parerythrobacter lacustris]|uniref:Isoaspartyl peptidase/L-asparaginase n=1 Tax=Parerythrobacter lacustris TaxID=2969984 RepID=A0ABT1XM20_9SPHN|nr:isoaspartyl peptidase/L-asparaginase [Parerythrobacter lacustris]MCR2832713.1 isoaspartyl peptidase/L-asparaginase [Parerythrobacter lacustris]